MSSNTMKCTESFGRVRYILAVLLLAALLLIPSVTGATAGMAWQAIVKSAACVQGPYVLLGEIAYPAGSMDDATWESLANIKLWKASTRAGRPVAVSRDKLRSILKYYLGDMVENLILPSQITVQTGGRVISGEELKSRVVAFLTPRAEDLGGDVEFKDFHLPRQIFFPNLYDTLSLSANDIVPGRNQVKIHGVTPDGKIVTSKAGTVFINVWKAIPVAAKPMNRFERVSPANVSFQRVNLAYRQNVWDGTGGPWRMARTLGRGQPFTLSHLEPIPLIEKGERVYLTFQGKRVKLTIKAVALGEAGMGQQVSVKNLQSNKTVLATVISDDTVVVR
ncbi:flagellar basal body P-ring formation chaperone FlgA [Pseudodesulfovibrio sediminis]|nr:flagellar basal body P-ring formation chaperone FlgA [Pseudodesulfovibrio sediminis]